MLVSHPSTQYLSLSFLIPPPKLIRPKLSFLCPHPWAKAAGALSKRAPVEVSLVEASLVGSEPLCHRLIDDG